MVGVGSVFTCREEVWWGVEIDDVWDNEWGHEWRLS